MSTTISSSNDVFESKALQRIKACYDESTKTIFAFVAIDSFAVLYKLHKDLAQGSLVEFTNFLTIKGAIMIFVINNEQVAVLSPHQLLVVRHDLDQIKASEVKKKQLVGSNIDFKFSFKKQIVEFTTSKNTFSIIYGKQSI